MNKPILTSALILGSVVASQAAVIAVMDGGSWDDGSNGASKITNHTTVVDKSTNGDSFTGSGSFSSDNFNWGEKGTSWNTTESDFDKISETGSKTATWTFSGLTVGSQWDVYSTWNNSKNRTTKAPYSINGGAPIEVSQKVAPTADLLLNDSYKDFNFQKIGTATVDANGDLKIELSNADDNWTIVDAVAIQAVPEPSSAALLGLGGLALILRRRK